MSKTAKTVEPTITHDLTPERTTCPHCGGHLRADYTNTRTLHTLVGVTRLTLTIRRCHHAACPAHKTPYRPEAEGSLALPHHESELVVRQGQRPFGLGAVRRLVGRTRRVVTAADGEGQPGDADERVQRPRVGVVGPQVPAAVRAGGPFRGEVVGNSGFDCLRRLGHGPPSRCDPNPTRSSTSRPSHVCRPRFFPA